MEQARFIRSNWYLMSSSGEGKSFPKKPLGFWWCWTERALEVAAGKEGIVTKQRSSWRKVCCAPLVECKWIVAVFLVYFHKRTYWIIYLKKSQLEQVKDCNSSVFGHCQTLGMATRFWSHGIPQQRLCWLCTPGMAPRKRHRQVIPDLV